MVSPNDGWKPFFVTNQLIGSQRHTPKSRDLYGMLKNWLSDQNKMVDDTSPYISLILGMGTSLPILLADVFFYNFIRKQNHMTVMWSHTKWKLTFLFKTMHLIHIWHDILMIVRMFINENDIIHAMAPLEYFNIA